MMLLGRFDRFLRLFRYKNLVKRYVDVISKKLEEIDFLRLSTSVTALNILIALSLIVFKDFRIIESTIWVWANFLKFNYETTIDDLVVLSIVIKILGLIYYGIVISTFMTIGRNMYERFKERKGKKKQEKTG